MTSQVVLSATRESAGSTEISASRVVSCQKATAGYRNLREARKSAIPALSQKLANAKPAAAGSRKPPFRGAPTPASDASGFKS